MKSLLLLLETEYQYRYIFQPLFFTLYLHICRHKVQMSPLYEGQSPQFQSSMCSLPSLLCISLFTYIHFCPALTSCLVVRKSPGAFWKVSRIFVCLRVQLLPDSREHSTLSFDQSPILCVCSPTELLRHHRPKASQTSRQASDALHAVQPEGKQEGKTPIHGVCFYCLSSHPLKNYEGF